MVAWRRYCGIVAVLLLTTAAAQVYAAPAAAPQQAVAPTYNIYATREGLVGYTTANGHVIQPRDRFVALPSRSALSPNGTDTYKVRLTYNGRTVVVPVWDIGPWNTTDDYWSATRRYRDLPVGVPMAFAAFHHGYNGGRDEFGRRVLHPNGIDIADGTFLDDLGMTKDDFVQVTFLWLGEDPGPGNARPIPTPAIPQEPPAPPAPAPTPAPPPAPPPPPVDEGAVSVDNDTDGFSTAQGNWSSERCGVNGSHVWTYSTPDPGQSESLAAWTPALPLSGFYEVKVFIPACGRAATNGARYRITHSGGVAEATLDQQANAGAWASLGVFRFGSESESRVELSDVASDSKRAVRFDAVAWVPRTDTAPPETTITMITRKDNGYLVQWGGRDDISGIAGYDVQVRQLPQGGWNNWKQDSGETAAWFGPDEGKHFAFRVRARDGVGNLEPWPANADRDSTCAGREQPATNCTP